MALLPASAGALRGDAIFPGKQEKSSAIVYVSNSGKLDSYWQGD